VDSLVERIDALIHMLPQDVPTEFNHSIIDEYETPKAEPCPILPPHAIGLIIGAMAGFALGGT